jgi:hypothetical protein
MNTRKTERGAEPVPSRMAVRAAPLALLMRLYLPRNTMFRLSFIAFLAVLVHGYHLGADDAEIYVPAIKRAADPGLYPFDPEFFMSHAHFSLFSDLVGGSARLTHLPINFVIFSWHVGCIFLLLLASWRLLRACFLSDTARWSGVAFLAATLSVPIAGTALVIMDPYLTARSLSTPATIFTIACYVSNRRREALAWLMLTALVHPQMSVYTIAFLGCLWLTRHFRLHADLMAAPGLTFFSGLPFLFELQPARGAAREALLSRAYFFVSNWAWYEWIGVFAPLALAWWCSSRRLSGTTPVFRSLLRTLVPFGLVFTVAAVVLTSSPRLENFTRLQPMRCFHVIYAIFFVLLGGLIGEYGLKSSVWRWLSLFVPLAASMYFLQDSQFPSSVHVEWPGYGYHNTWNSAFFWIRLHTPRDAIFALDPNYMLIAGEDQHGFRAVAERSALADAVKDSGAVSLFPQLADRWKSQVQAQNGWKKFDRRDFEHLAKLYPVTWILTRSPGPAGMTCPYQNEGLSVCRIDVRGVAGLGSSTRCWFAATRGASLYKTPNPKLYATRL